jgi:hypothetical protein
VISGWEWTQFIVVTLFGAQTLLSCGLPAAAPPLAEADSGIVGRVVTGPTCPVEQAGQTCPDEPLVATLVVRDRGSDRDVRTLQSGEDGQFRASLAPGEYWLVPISPNPGAPPYAEPIAVTVAQGRYTYVTVRYDSGIR